MVKKVKVHLKELEEMMPRDKYQQLLEGLEKVRDGVTFDKYITTVLGKFKNVKDYYAAAKTIDKLHKIEVPAFTLQSEDDFLVDQTILPRSLPDEVDNVMLAITKKGSHCCFFSGSIWPE
jgi:predicted alpha/beta-fold hydrolase